MRKIISIVTVFCFLLSNVSFALEVRPSEPQGNINLAPPLLFGDLGDDTPNHKFLTWATMYLTMELEALDEVSDIDEADNLKTIQDTFQKSEYFRQAQSHKIDTHPSRKVSITAYFNEADKIEQLADHIFSVPVSIEENGKRIGNFRLLFSTIRNRESRFPVVFCASEELNERIREAIAKRDRLPERPKADEEAIERYEKIGEGGIDAILKYAYAHNLVSEPDSRIFDFKEEALKLQENINLHISNPHSKKPYKEGDIRDIADRQFSLVLVTEEVQRMLDELPGGAIVDQKGVVIPGIKIAAASSNHAIHVFVKKDMFQELVNPEKTDRDEKRSVKSSLKKREIEEFLIKIIIREMRAILDLPILRLENGVPRVENGVPISELNIRYEEFEQTGQRPSGIMTAKIANLDRNLKTRDYAAGRKSSKSPEDAKKVIELSEDLQVLMDKRGYFTRQDYKNAWEKVSKEHPELEFGPTISLSTVTTDLESLVSEGFLIPATVKRSGKILKKPIGYRVNDKTKAQPEHEIVEGTIEKLSRDDIVTLLKDSYATLYHVIRWQYGGNIAYEKAQELFDVEIPYANRDFESFIEGLVAQQIKGLNEEYGRKNREEKLEKLDSLRAEILEAENTGDIVKEVNARLTILRFYSHDKITAEAQTGRLYALLGLLERALEAKRRKNLVWKIQTVLSSMGAIYGGESVGNFIDQLKDAAINYSGGVRFDRNERLKERAKIAQEAGNVGTEAEMRLILYFSGTERETQLKRLKEITGIPESPSAKSSTLPEKSSETAEPAEKLLEGQAKLDILEIYAKTMDKDSEAIKADEGEYEVCEIIKGERYSIFKGEARVGGYLQKVVGVWRFLPFRGGILRNDTAWERNIEIFEGMLREKDISLPEGVSSGEIFSLLHFADQKDHVSIVALDQGTLVVWANPNTNKENPSQEDIDAATKLRLTIVYYLAKGLRERGRSIGFLLDRPALEDVNDINVAEKFGLPSDFREVVKDVVPFVAQMEETRGKRGIVGEEFYTAKRRDAFTVEEAIGLGATMIKSNVFFYCGPELTEAEKAFNEQQWRFIEELAVECQRNNIGYVSELLFMVPVAKKAEEKTYQNTEEYIRAHAEATLEAARRMKKIKGVTLQKLAYPYYGEVAMELIPERERHTKLRELADIVAEGWLILSAGEGWNTFEMKVREAAEHGRIAGMLVGRSPIKNITTKARDQKGKEVDAIKPYEEIVNILQTEGVEKLLILLGFIDQAPTSVWRGSGLSKDAVEKMPHVRREVAERIGKLEKERVSTETLRLLQEALATLPEEYLHNGISHQTFVQALQEVIGPLFGNVDFRSAFIFSEKATFDNGIGILLPKLAKSGKTIAVVAPTDRQKRIIDELNKDKPERERIIYADSVVEITTMISAPKYYYFKVEGDPEVNMRAIVTFDITYVVKQIIDALGKMSGIVESGLLEKLHEAARKFAIAA